MSRCIVIGDVHGCIEELRELLFEVVEIRETDRLVFLGDLIDRGPDPAGVVALAHQLHAESVIGNHEEKALRWRRHEKKRREDPTHYKNPMQPVKEARLAQWSKIPDEHWAWIEKWPCYLHLNSTWTAVHAGCLPDVEIEKQHPNELMRLRYVKSIGQPSGYVKYKMAPLNEKGDVSASCDQMKGERIDHWTELWSGPRNIVYGHYVWDQMHRTESPTTKAITMGIDTGCVHGGDLTAMVFCEDHYYTARVAAHQVYADRRFWAEE